MDAVPPVAEPSIDDIFRTHDAAYAIAESLIAAK